MSNLIPLFVVIGLVLLFSAQDWRRSIQAVLVLVVLEGALRKWVLPQASQVIYFLKDFVLIGAYIRYFLLSSTQIQLFTKKSSILLLVGCTAFWAGVQALNPSLGSPIIGLFGIKSYFLYVPLIWLVPQMFETEEALYRFIRSYLLLLIPVGLLAIVQFFSPPTSPLNVYAWGEEGPAVVSSGLNTVRVTGTFSYLTGYSTYLLACLCLLLPVISRPQSRLWQVLTLTEGALIAATSFMTGSRGLVLGSVLLITGYGLLLALTSFSSFFSSTRKLFLPAIISFLVVSQGTQLAFNSFWKRVETANDNVVDRIINPFLQPFKIFHLKGLDGYGLGATFQANGIIRRAFQLPPGEVIPVYYENEMGRIALEVGPIGFFLWYGLRLLLLATLFQVCLKLRHPFLRQLAISIFVYQGVTFISQMVYNHTANVYHWFFYGFILLLPHLERVEQWQQAQQTNSMYGYQPHLSSTPNW
ncbi:MULTISPECIES: hypothetical protein [Cyanophyceae]|uniref:hypothetical protein n=1 Tax=Cyanophyceae TaxID=3028117 RepID=UPI00168703BF|nr:MULTISPECIES: hypothetical protein [Cyanophyceae]MBD1916323.1 hypothetical protein [Phormidium sp. FACHB-77]MBD2032615.1 hypothetical protein [Phormidium sp. FACHB-322]MBD2049987.1 hypothetical protein [Leptolyngbya sp. FACHB-60]